MLTMDSVGITMVTAEMACFASIVGVFNKSRELFGLISLDAASFFLRDAGCFAKLAAL